MMKVMHLLMGASSLAEMASQTAFAQTVPSKQPLPAPGVPAASTATKDGDGSEIIVTASRRNESIIKVPTAISAYTDSKLRDENLFSLTDLTARAPNTQISNFGNKANINIRGIGNGNLSNSGGEPGVAISADGVYLGQTALALTSLLDLNRVEILRGPQGTLFGRNATGGAVNLIPNLPTADPSFGVDLTAGLDPTMVRAAAFASGPISSDGVLMGRLSVVKNYNRGYTRNTAPTRPRHLDGLDNTAIRGQLMVKPADYFDVRLLVEHQRIDDTGFSGFLLGNPSGTPYTSPFGRVPINGVDADNPKRREIPNNYCTRKLKSTNINITANLGLSGGNLKALASYQEGSQFSEYALPYDKLPALMQTLDATESIGRLALQFLILTAARSGEVRGARWSEIDMAATVWTVPADRMKAGKQHLVPLSAHALAILKRMADVASDELVFPGITGRSVDADSLGKGRPGALTRAAGKRPMSDMTLTKVLRTAGATDATVHGMRSSFRDWAAEQTTFPGEVVEAAPAHTIGNKVEAAYRRTNYLEKRRGLMEAWASFAVTLPTH